MAAVAPMEDPAHYLPYKRLSFDFCLSTSTRFDNRHIRSCLASRRSVSGRGPMAQGDSPHNLIAGPILQPSVFRFRLIPRKVPHGRQRDIYHARRERSILAAWAADVSAAANVVANAATNATVTATNAATNAASAAAVRADAAAAPTATPAAATTAATTAAAAAVEYTFVGERHSPDLPKPLRSTSNSN